MQTISPPLQQKNTPYPYMYTLHLNSDSILHPILQLFTVYFQSIQLVWLLIFICKQIFYQGKDVAPCLVQAAADSAGSLSRFGEAGTLSRA